MRKKERKEKNYEQKGEKRIQEKNAKNDNKIMSDNRKKRKNRHKEERREQEENYGERYKGNYRFLKI